MPLPNKFYDIDGNEVSLDVLCRREPAWAANRIRDLTKQLDSAKPANLKNTIRAYRLKDNEDPFVLYQDAKISKGKLLEYIVEAMEEGEEK